VLLAVEFQLHRESLEWAQLEKPKKERKEKMERCKINHYRGCGNHFARECLTDRGLEETVKEFRNNIDYFIEGMQEHLDTVKSYNDCPF
jgi:hypothetical protein